jgi:hypothetical protein
LLKEVNHYVSDGSWQDTVTDTAATAAAPSAAAGAMAALLLRRRMHGMGWRRFVSPAEELERLHDYPDQLKKEWPGWEGGSTS